MKNRPAKKVLLIGWDGADWKAITPLLDEGKMPALERFVNEGVMGNLATLNPPLSPMLWTSAVTGMRPFKHGIHGFAEPNPHTNGIRPATNVSRKVKAVWNILNQSEFKSNVIGWWPSHPAEPINGVMVSNLYQVASAPRDKPWTLLPGTVHPRRLSRNIANLRIHPSELTAAHILPFIPKASEIDQEKDKRLEMLASIIAECSTVHACATAVMQLEPWDFMAILYDAIDHFGHGFMRYHPPRRESISDKDFEIYKGVVEAGYRFHDMMLDVLLKLAGEDTTVILISDHGFHPDHLRPNRIPRVPAGPAIEHRPYGIIAMKGPGIKKDERIYGATLLDITPTILMLYGLPVGADMDGKPLVQAFEELPVFATIPSWEEKQGDAGMHPPDMQIDPVEAQELLKQLVALGYIEEPGEDKEKAVYETIRESRYNLSRSYMDANRHGEAMPILEELWKAEPDQIRFAHHLAACYRELGRLDDFRRTVEAITETQKRLMWDARQKLAEYAEKENLTDQEKREVINLRYRATPSRYYIDYLIGTLLVAEGKHEKALEHLYRAEKAEPRLPNLHLQIGNIFIGMKKWQDAECAFNRAIEIDPENAQAHFGLCRCFLEFQRDPEAADEALAAIGLLYFYPQAHYCLGVALERLGHVERAVEAFQVAISQNPNFDQAHQYLANIYRQHPSDREDADFHSLMTRIIRKQQDTTETSASPDLPEAEPARPFTSDSGQAVAAEGPLTVRAERAENVDGDFVTIVSGLPRSGTSMMMQMLSAGGYPVLTDGSREADADNPLGYFEFQKVKQLPANHSWLAECSGKAVKVIAHFLPFLPTKFKYKVIFMERDLKEIMASQRAMLRHQNRNGANLSNERLCQILAQQIRWTKNLLASRNIPVLYINYGYAVEHPHEVANHLKGFLHEQPKERCMAGAVNDKLYRQRYSE